MIGAHLIEWLREALGSKISQLVDMFDDLEFYAREAAVTTFGQLAQHGERHMLGNIANS
jgi:hypothetical protein